MQSFFRQPSTMFLSSYTYTHTCVVKVVGALDLRAALGDGLGGLEVGHLDLHGLAQGSAGADDDVARLQVQVDLEIEKRMLRGGRGRGISRGLTLSTRCTVISPIPGLCESAAHV